MQTVYEKNAILLLVCVHSLQHNQLLAETSQWLRSHWQECLLWKISGSGKEGNTRCIWQEYQPGLWTHVNLIYVNFTSEEVPYRVHMCYRDHQTEQVVHHRNQLPTYCSPNLAGQVVLC